MLDVVAHKHLLLHMAIAEVKTCALVAHKEAHQTLDLG